MGFRYLQFKAGALHCLDARHLWRYTVLWSFPVCFLLSKSIVSFKWSTCNCRIRLTGVVVKMVLKWNFSIHVFSRLYITVYFVSEENLYHLIVIIQHDDIFRESKVLVNMLSVIPWEIPVFNRGNSKIHQIVHEKAFTTGGKLFPKSQQRHSVNPNWSKTTVIGDKRVRN